MIDEKITLEERAKFYNVSFPDFPELIVGKDNRIQGMWIMGNNYKTKGDYGAYPYGYMKRISTLFPDCKKNILQLFSVNIEREDGVTRFDIHPEYADVCGDAHELSKYPFSEWFDIIYADPPYSVEDCDHYGTAMVNRNKILKECHKVLSVGGFLVWLDQVLPMYRKDEFRIVGVIGMIKSTNHRFRVVTIFQAL